MRLCLTLITLFSFSPLFAAPIPLTSSSEFIGADKGFFHSELGFSINANKTSWKLDTPEKTNPHIVTMYRAPSKKSGVQPALTVRVDNLRKKTNLRGYVKTWIKDYPRLGFKVLSAKPVKVKSQRGFLLDIVNEDNLKQLRQVFFLKDKKIVILSCRDHKDNFLKSLKDCNQIIKNFHWM